MVHLNSCSHFCLCKLDATLYRWKGGLYIHLYMKKKVSTAKKKSYFWFSSLYWRASTLAREASALMQSDCCLSHNNVLKIHLKAQYQPVPLPYQSTSSFLQQLNMIQYLTFLSCTLCSFANGQQRCISNGGFVLFLMEWLIVATLKLASSFKKQDVNQ